jgi:protoheme IX farnesyltransferase
MPFVALPNTLNMYLERDVDVKMSRTRRRPLPAGRLRPELALRFGVLQGLVGLPIFGFGGERAHRASGCRRTLHLRRHLHAAETALLPCPVRRRDPWCDATLARLGGRHGCACSRGARAVRCRFLLANSALSCDCPVSSRRLSRRRLEVLPNESGVPITRWLVAVGLVLRLFTTLALVPLGLGGPVYLVGALVLGAILLAWGVIGLVRPGDDAWARRLFVLSVGFLPLLFALLIAS